MNNLVRKICLVLYYGFARFLPHSGAPYQFGSKGLRYVLCKRLFRQIGRNVNIEHRAYFRGGDEIEIGDNSGLGINCYIPHAKIGRNVMMGPDVLYIESNHRFDRTDIPMMQQGQTEGKGLIIGDDVWIGARVIFLPGISVGRGAIAAAGAVITRDVPEFAIVAGNPARIKGYRNKLPATGD